MSTEIPWAEPCLVDASFKPDTNFLILLSLLLCAYSLFLDLAFILRRSYHEQPFRTERSLERVRMTRFLCTLTALLLLLPGFATATLYDDKVVEKIEVIFVNEPADSVYTVKNVTAKIRTRAGDIFSQNDFDND